MTPQLAFSQGAGAADLLGGAVSGCAAAAALLLDLPVRYYTCVVLFHGDALRCIFFICKVGFLSESFS